MLSVTNHLLCVVLLLGLAIAEASAQQNQQKECFTVIMNNSTGGGSLGAILLNKCTGDSWMLIRTTLANGATTNRWYPLSAENSEYVSAPPR
jgi:hypothetical protein